MTACARFLAFSLLATAQLAGPSIATAQAAGAAPVRPTYTGEPLPAGAPTNDYELAAWCFGAMSEYLDVYDMVKPSLRAIDKEFGSSVPGEKEPYAADMAAARKELAVLAGAVTAAEKASPDPIGAKGAAAVTQGRAIWSLAEQKTRRELARAWLSWAMPDKCDSTSRQLAAKSALLGQALKYNSEASTPQADPSAAAPPPVTSGDESAPPPASEPAPETAPEPAPTPAPAPTDQPPSADSAPPPGLNS